MFSTAKLGQESAKDIEMPRFGDEFCESLLIKWDFTRQSGIGGSCSFILKILWKCSLYLRNWAKERQFQNLGMRTRR
jgi:hypothetical protein